MVDGLRERGHHNEEVTRTQEQLNQGLRAELDTVTRDRDQLLQDLGFCRDEIDGLSEELDELKKANDRYKNMCFRNKIRAVNPK